MFPIIDAHLHLWDTRRLSYPWLSSHPTIDRPYLLDDYDTACGRHKIEQMVFLQCECGDYRAEVEWITELAQLDPRIVGIVSYSPLEKGLAARPMVEELAANPLVKGIRRIIQYEDDMAFCLQPNFVRGVQMLADFNLSFDLCISHQQLPNAIHLVSQCPKVRFVLDHLGKPDIKNQQFEPWATHMRRLANLPHVSCKVSGMVSEADHEHWTPADCKPFLDHILNCFGPDRVLFGSDWPVVVLAGDVSRWLDALLVLTNGLSLVEQKKMFSDNAKRCYRL